MVDDVLIDGISSGLSKDEGSDGNHDDTVSHQGIPTTEIEQTQR